MDSKLMPTFTYEISTEHNIYPNITVCDRLRDGELIGWRITANEGYVYYDTNANTTETNPDTEEEIPVTYYFKTRYLPLNCEWDSFSLVAVPSADVDKKYIF